jgi:hypothetical protein
MQHVHARGSASGSTKAESRDQRGDGDSHLSLAAGVGGPSCGSTSLSARRIAEIIAKLPTSAAYLDGQTTVLRDDGVTSFAALQDALSRHQAER